ncbi:PhzF family phenazine biosynthesis protein [Catellatospora sp. NPDC049111]|uniref:PhzF family phenazine biosynthesis protein n=1 Tax=Catellatospora sp. NPDC049111 TaxID=3155271 RepID=UPI00340D03F3
MADLHVLRVFCGPGGCGGNPLGVVSQGATVVGERQRLAVAAELGFSETVFVDDPARGVVDIYTPSVRLPFAGHPLVGTSWLLRHLGTGVDVLRPPAGDVSTWQDGDFTWIAGRADWAADRELRQHASAAEVDGLPSPPPGSGFLYAWAWQDEAGGVTRARAFPRRGDSVIEDEATGAAALLLAHTLGKALDIRQGVASQILARPRPDGWIEVGGRVALDEVRTL